MAKTLTNISLGLAALLSVVTALYYATWKITEQHLFQLLWIVSPYILCRIASIGLLRSKKTTLRNISAFFATAVLLFSALSYGSLYFGTQSSTSALAFIAIPLYTLIAEVIVLGPANLLLLKAEKQIQ